MMVLNSKIQLQNQPVTQQPTRQLHLSHENQRVQLTQILENIHHKTITSPSKNIMQEKLQIVNVTPPRNSKTQSNIYKKNTNTSKDQLIFPPQKSLISLAQATPESNNQRKRPTNFDYEIVSPEDKQLFSTNELVLSPI